MESTDKRKTVIGITLLVLIGIVVVFIIATKDSRQLPLAEAKHTAGNFQETIDRVGIAACSGEKINEELLPLIAQDNVDGKAYICDSANSSLSTIFPQSDPIRAHDLSELKYYVTLEESISEDKTCQYTDGYKLDLQPIEWDIKLYEIKSGNLVARKLFFGSSSCPESYQFTIGKYTEELKGNTPSTSDIRTYIESPMK